MSSGQDTGFFKRIRSGAAKLGGDRKGATAIEYALIAAGISITIAAVVGNIGTQVATFFAAIPGWFGGGGGGG